MSSVGVVIVAAGSGERLGSDRPKALVAVGGQTMLERAVRAASAQTRPADIVVVVPADHLERATALVEAIAPCRVVVGGATRQRSVALGLAALTPEAEVVLVHDAARCLASPALFDAVVDAVERSGEAVIPVLPVADTIKRVDADGEVVATVPRDDLRAVQTPQGFPRRAIAALHAAASDEHTDDAALWERAGRRVRTVPGEASAFKITTPDDLRRAEDLVAGHPVADHSAAEGARLRTGIGIDVHAIDPDAELWLAGVHWPGEPGLSGHSDGDSALHAICDALLSAGGLGDIGARFGTADPRFAGARSDVFVRETLLLLAAEGLSVVNVAVEIVAERPRIGPRRAELETHLSALLGAPVTVAATTSDRLGATGRGEGIGAVATALLRGPAPA